MIGVSVFCAGSLQNVKLGFSVIIVESEKRLKLNYLLSSEPVVELECLWMTEPR